MAVTGPLSESTCRRRAARSCDSLSSAHNAGYKWLAPAPLQPLRHRLNTQLSWFIFHPIDAVDRAGYQGGGNDESYM